MVIKPWGYALWENMQRVLDDMFKATGHQNAYFPLFIPLSFLQKEAAHVEGFAKECAVVTHHRLEKGADGKLVPAGELEEPLVVRPTSETIIGDAFSRWVQSYRDLPLLINQWATSCAGRCARACSFARPSSSGRKATRRTRRARRRSPKPCACSMSTRISPRTGWRCRSSRARRPPANVSRVPYETFCIEAMMQDRKALQAGTSHFLGQNFAKASDIQFLDRNGVQAARVDDELGRIDAPDRRAHHDALGRRWSRAAAEACAGARRDHPDLPFGRRAADACSNTATRVATELRVQRFVERPCR